jgi:AcrR family transcriptional regulator
MEETGAMAARRGNVGDPTARSALLDAAQELMVEEGYAAVTARRVATKAHVNSALVFYYFETMDGLFIALFQRGAEGSFERLQAALTSEQPLWGFWEMIHDRSRSALTMEFIALANHRKNIRKEIAEYSRRFRRAQLETLSSVLAGYGLDPERWPAASIVLVLSGISRFMLIEEAFDVDVGHAETITIVEEQIASLEGARRRIGGGSTKSVRIPQRK